MSSKKPVSWSRVWGSRIGRGITLALALSFVVLLVLYLLIPWLGTRYGLPLLAKILDTPQVEAEIHHAGLSGLDINSISLGPDGGIQVRRLHVQWSLSGLLHGQIDSVELAGVQVRLAEQDGQWSIVGLPALLAPSEGKTEKRVFFPTIHEFFINGRISLAGSQIATSIPISLIGNLNSSGQLNTQVHTALVGQALDLSIGANLRTQDVQLSCSIPSASIAALADLIPGFALPLGGQVHLEANASSSPHSRPVVDAAMTLDRWYALLGNSYLAQQGSWTVQGKWAESGLALHLAPLALAHPVSVVLSIEDIAFDFSTQSIACQWRVVFGQIPVLDTAPELSGTLKAQISDLGITVQVNGQLLPLVAAIDQVALKLEPSMFELTALVTSSGTRLEGDFALGQIRLSQDSLVATLTGLQAQANATLDAASQGFLRVHGGKLALQQPGMNVSTTKLDIEAQFALSPEFQASGTLVAAVTGQNGDVQAKANLDIPLSWPEGATRPGSVDAKLVWKKADLAQISSRIVQDVHGFALDGQVHLLPLNTKTSLKGHVAPLHLSRSWVEVQGKQQVRLPAKLAQFVPQLSSWTGAANLDLKARLELPKGVPVCPLSLKIKDLKISHEQSKISLTGGNISLAFADLLSLRSDPDQHISFDTLQTGSIILEQGDIHFQVEALHSILVETCTANWAGGKVGTQAFRINPGVEEYLVDLYCDRVGLVQALSQFGMSQAQGGGSVNGRIPVHYAQGSLSFDNGFLYSTPGENGVLRIEGTDILTAGIPPDSPQYAQLDLAAEALKDFAYEWAKIRMNTVDQELVVSLELDGKPAHALPFSFDREFGGFARVTAGSPGSVFQGIRLDMNFKLPLDQLLQYKQLLELMNKGG